MPIVCVQPQNVSIEVDPETKLLVAANRLKVPIRFGCASCRCGTCGVSVKAAGNLKPMATNERELLSRMSLPTDGSVRLACQARILDGQVEIDLEFQNSYSPDQADGD